MRVALASLLNPVHHPRLYEKEARTLAQAGYEVHVIGRSIPELPPSEQHLRIHPIELPNFRRGARRKATQEIGQLVSELAPDVLHVHTWELLAAARPFARRGGQVVYDVHEDYVANLKADTTRPAWQRCLAARYVRWVETRAMPHLAGLVLAEAGYDTLFPGATVPRVLVPNTFQAARMAETWQRPFPPEWPLLVQTGNMAERWGVFQALDLWAALNQEQPVGLVLAGHAPAPAVLARVKSRIAHSGHPNRVALVGGSEYVSPREIQAIQQQADVLLALYTPVEALQGRFPTKFYEGMAAKRPTLFTDFPEWLAANNRQAFGVAVSHQETEAQVKAVQSILANRAAWLEKLTAIPAEAYVWEAHGAPELLAFYAQLTSSGKASA